MNRIPTLAVRRRSSKIVLCSSLTAAFILASCQGLTPRATQLAARAGLRASLVQGTHYQHEIFVSPPAAGQPLFVYVEGDGSPWNSNGTRATDDPTPHRPLALQLAMHTARAVMYLGRPCYFSARNDSECKPAIWTSQRYSTEVVESMAAVVNRYVFDHRCRGVILIGYSGGGALVVLMAPRIPSSIAVVSIAANLDTDAWTAWHRYLPLSGSLNPADQAPLDPHIQQWHLLADRDTVVPPSLDRRYVERISAERIWHFATFDHVCCWVEQWPAILTRLDAAMQSAGP
jgi:dienelactone hydrolase